MKHNRLRGFVVAALLGTIAIAQAAAIDAEPAAPLSPAFGFDPRMEAVL